MKAAGMDKDEILVMLSELNDQLVEMEQVLQTSLEELRSEWIADHQFKLDECGKRLSAVEHSLDLTGDTDSEMRIGFTGKKVVKLELGY